MPTNLQGCEEWRGGYEIKGKRLISDYEREVEKLKKGRIRRKQFKKGSMIKKLIINVGL